MVFFRHPFSLEYWRCAAAQLKNPKMIIIAAILVALRVALKSIVIPVGENLNIYITFFVNALGGMIFGPVVALLGAAVSDTLGALIFPSGVYFFPFIFNEMLGSLLYALFLWRRELSTLRVILAKFSVTVLCNLLLNPLLMIFYYKFLNNGKSYSFVTLPRTIKNLALFPAEAALLVIFLSALIPALKSLKLIPQGQKNLLLSWKHYVSIAVLTLAAAAIVVVYYVCYLK